jgi:hypothetical protein
MDERVAKALGLATALSKNPSVKDDEALSQLTEKIIGCAIEVHRQLGPGHQVSSTRSVGMSLARRFNAGIR